MADAGDELRAGRLLVATPALADPNFARMVVLLLDHSESGALGVVLNKRARLAAGLWSEVVAADSRAEGSAAGSAAARSDGIRNARQGFPVTSPSCRGVL